MVNIKDYLIGHGYNVASDETTQHLEEWEEWYSGYVKGFHSYNVYNGIQTVGMNKSYLGMAKTVCEDWANLLLNEKVEITTNSEFDTELNDIFEYNNFHVKANQLIELSFAFGTGAFVEYLDADGMVVIDFIRAGMIYPLTWENGYISECAFGSVRDTDGTKQYYIQIHKLNELGLYIIENHIVDAETGHDIYLDEEMIDYVDTGSSVPLFQIITPNIVNNIDLDSPLGISVFGNAIDQLKGCDIVYDSYINEFNLGKKRLMIPIDMTTILMNEDGIRKPVFDNKDVLFYALPGSNDSDSSITEINMSIRSNDHELGIKKALDLLSFKCGLGGGRYSFESGGAKTATEIISEKSELFQNLSKHKILLNSSITGLVRAVAYLTNSNISEVHVDFDDSIIHDEDAERARDIRDLSIGAMTLLEYRMKWYKEEESEAIKKIASQMDPII